MGILYIVATPIGNLKDITFRAIETLKEVDLILCEDTRHTVKLLNHYNISKPLVSYFQHSQISKINYILEQLKQGKKMALVTDAGTPGISDPGGKLIEIITTHLPSCNIVPIPGPTALIAALSVSGFPTDKFIFMGFPPAKKKRKKFFEEIINSKYLVVFYESPHRIIKTLNELENMFQLRPSGDLPKAKTGFMFQVVVCRELTKKFETIYRGNIEEIISQLEKSKNQFYPVRNSSGMLKLAADSKGDEVSNIAGQQSNISNGVRGEFVVMINKTKHRLSQNKV